MHKRPLTFTIVGSRQTPEEDVEVIYDTSLELLQMGGFGYSGAAPGIDDAFTRAALEHQRNTGMPGKYIGKIFLHSPHRPFNGYDVRHPSGLFHSFLTEVQKSQAAIIARVARCGFYGLNEIGRDLHTRNTQEVLGEFMNEWSDVLICSAPLNTRGLVQGGTATAVKIASACDIPVINLQREKGPEQLKRLMTYLRAVGPKWDARGIREAVTIPKPVTEVKK